MPAVVYGELSADGRDIALHTDTDNAWDIQDIVDRLKFGTPDFKPQEDGSVHVRLSWVAVTQIVHSFPDTDRFKWVPGPLLSKWIVDEIINRSCQGDFTGETPFREPMDHQTAGAIAIGMNGRFLLADEPGAGKTTCALMGLAELETRGKNPWPAFVVCPAAVIDPWLEEVAAVYPDWRPYSLAYRGPGRARLLRTKGIKLLVMSYETMRNDVGDTGQRSGLVDYRAQSVVFDECHKLCGYKTKQSVRARRLAKHIPHVIGASGTPITKNAGNFWPILNGMYPDAYPSRDRYKARYTMDKGQDYGCEIGGLDPLREPEFRLVMQGTMRRVAKADVLKDLPPKTYQVRYVDIPAKWRGAYDEMEADMIAHLPDAEHTTALTAMSTLSKMMRLRQLASSACDVEEYEELDDKPNSETFGEMIVKIRVTPKEPCWKGEALVEILDELHQDDEGNGIQHGHRPVIAFSPFRTLVMLTGSLAERKGYKVGYIVGGMTDKQRTEARLAFEDNKLDLICVTTGAGGTGLTLVAADTVVFLNRPWSFVEATQSEDRAHRRGQTKSVQVIDLETRNSIESRVRDALQDKAHNLAELLQDTRIAEEFLGGKRKVKT
jgi:SNF2 family DNA or RNA helicase